VCGDSEDLRNITSSCETNCLSQDDRPFYTLPAMSQSTSTLEPWKFLLSAY